MANYKAWADYDRLKALRYNVKQELAAIVRTSDEIQRVKNEILADTTRTSEFTKLMLEDPNLTTQQVLSVIAQIKTMADYILSHPI